MKYSESIHTNPKKVIGVLVLSICKVLSAQACKK